MYKASNRITLDSQQFTLQRKIEDVAKKSSTSKEMLPFTYKPNL
jgi:hypothetical protein